MILLYSHESRLVIENIKNLLETFGFELVIKNEYANGGIGELSPFDCWPELWLLNEHDLSAANKALEKILTQRQESWICQSCNETNFDSFELCWQCNTERSLLQT